MPEVTNFLNASLNWIEMQGIWAPILFILIFVIITLAFAPASILTIGAGAVFGFTKGVILASLASTITAAISFLISRYLLRNWVEKKLASRPRFRAIDQAIAHEGWKMVALLRMTPLIPFGMQNYGLGLTGVSFWQATFASWLGLLPAICLLVYTGTIAQVVSTGTTTLQKIAYALGLIIALITVARISKIATRALARQLELEKISATLKPGSPE